MRSKCVNLPPFRPSVPSFKGMTSVRYVKVDGVLNENPEVIENVTKAFVKTLKENKPEHMPVRYAAKKAIADFAPHLPYQSVQYLKSEKLGQKHNIITGAEAFSLKNIWAQGKVSLANKKKQAGDIVRKLVNSPTTKIAIEAATQNIKGKIKYIIKNVFITV